MKRLAIRPSEQTTFAKSLVIPQAGGEANDKGRFNPEPEQEN